MWRIVQVIPALISVMWCALCGVCLPKDEVSSEVPTAPVDFQVMIHSGLVDDTNGESKPRQEAEEIAWQPCLDGVIYLTERKGAPGLTEWLETLPKPVPETITYRVENQRLVPRMALGRVGDRLHLWTGENGLSVMTSFIPPPSGLSGMGRYYRLWAPDKVPIILMDDLRPNMRAYLLITDHGIAAVTDQQGRAHFPAIPVGIELPMRVVVPWLRQGPTFASETLVFAQARFSLKVEQGTSVTHEIRVSVGPAGGDGSARTKAGTN